MTDIAPSTARHFCGDHYGCEDGGNGTHEQFSVLIPDAASSLESKI